MIDNLKENLGNRIVTSGKVYLILSKAIFRGDIKPGERLIESKLAKSLNISRTPVREAIIELKQKGLVVPSSPKGVKVAPIPTDFDMEEFYDVIEVLRGLSARKAAKNISKSEIAKLKKIIEQSKGYLKCKSINEIVKLNIKFHQIIEKASRNEELVFLLDIHYKRLNERFSTIASNIKRQQKGISEHQEIVEAIENRDEEVAERLMRRHINSAKRSLLTEIKGKNDGKK